MKHWDNRYMNIAEEVSSWSKDPSSKIGCVAVSEKGQVLTTGYNGFPRGMNDDRRLDNRIEKYKFVVHAEANAIYNATYNGVSLLGSTLYVHGLPCCSKCALAIAQVGIKRVVSICDTINDRWKDEAKLAIEIFEECGIEYSLTEYSQNSDVQNV